MYIKLLLDYLFNSESVSIISFNLRFCSSTRPRRFSVSSTDFDYVDFGELSSFPTEP